MYNFIIYAIILIVITIIFYMTIIPFFQGVNDVWKGRKR